MKKRLKKKNFFIALIVLLILLFAIVNPINLYYRTKLENINYSKESSKLILKLGFKDELLEYEYSEFIDKNVSDPNFEIDNVKIYRDLNTVIYVDTVNKLIDKGYNVEEINYIIKHDTESINKLLELDKIDDISSYLEVSYGDLENIDRYISYKNSKGSDYEKTVRDVEIGLDKEPYEFYYTTSVFSYDMIVNKYNKLDSSFVPNDLVTVKKEYCVDSTEQGNKTMVESFYNMSDDLNKETGLRIYINSGYRSYKYQKELYDYYIYNYGKTYVKNYVAYPGFSEHQTGLAVDIRAMSNDTFQGTKEESWMKDNSYKYGFILRYTKSNKSITQYNEESWHYRYVGVDIATYIHENNITLEEYYVKFLKNK